MKLFNTLFSTYGNQGWWPTTKPNTINPSYHNKTLSEKQKLEICIGAILTQNTNWKNVEKAIIELNKNNLIDLKKLSTIKEIKLQSLIQSSGYFRQKTKKLKIFAKHVLANHKSLSKFFNQSKSNLRRELLSIWGIGPETADSMILYSAQKPIFVIDAYTKRIMSRINNKEFTYEQLQNYFHETLPKKTKLFNEYHALFVEHAKNHCKVKPECENCPLRKNCSTPS